MTTLLAMGVCGCSDSNTPVRPPRPGASSTASTDDLLAGPTTGPAQSASDQMKTEILKSVVRLLETAATRPGGANISIATENLNHYFEGIRPEEFRLDDATRAYLTEQLEGLPFRVEEFDQPAFELKDARHIEDCLMYDAIAQRIAGRGSQMEQVQRLFQWIITQVALAPRGALVPPQLASQGMEHVPARPYDVLTRGLATEDPGSTWAERSWAFISLCRQIGVDAGMAAFDISDSEEHNAWCCVVLIDGKGYLFDVARGYVITLPGTDQPATLEEAATIPEVLDSLDVPSLERYPIHAADLQGTVRILIDSSRQYFAPRMKLLQQDLAGANRMVLYRNPVEQRDAFKQALGDRIASIDLWELPLNVEYRLFNDPNFVRSTQYAIAMFNQELPILGARLLQLRGDLDEAKQAFVSFRFREAIRMGDEMVQLPPEVRQSLDLHATYFLATCQLEQGNADEAGFLFGMALKLAPAPEPGRLSTLYGWGANTNLARIEDAMGQDELAIVHFSRGNPTTEALGNLRRAEELIWENPFGPAPEPVAADPASETAESESDKAGSPSGG